MSGTEEAILRTLLELESAAASMKSNGPKPDLLAMFNRLDELTRQLPRTADPNLLHYLNRKSYLKARLLLQGRDAENLEGSCGGK